MILNPGACGHGVGASPQEQRSPRADQAPQDGQRTRSSASWIFFSFFLRRNVGLVALDAPIRATTKTPKRTAMKMRIFVTIAQSPNRA